jgi:hypothetical protein
VISKITPKPLAPPASVYQNRRRVRGSYGKSLLRRRGELVERSFAHCYDTGGMRRTHLRGHENILKRQLVHVGAFNLSLISMYLGCVPQQNCNAPMTNAKHAERTRSRRRSSEPEMIRKNAYSGRQHATLRLKELCQQRNPLLDDALKAVADRTSCK